MTRLTLVPPSMEVQTGWLDAVKGLVSSDALGAGAGACAAVNRQLPTSSTVNNNDLQLAGMSSLRTYTRQLNFAKVAALTCIQDRHGGSATYVIIFRRSHFTVTRH